MKWTRDYDSSDVEDRRGAPVGGGGGLGFLLPLFMRFGWKGLLIGGVAYFLISHFAMAPSGNQKAGHDDVRAFVSTVVDDAQNTFARASAGRYEKAHVVLYTGATRTACGLGQASVGPFYCPRDQKVYLDQSFFQELHDRFGAPGDFAVAYVIAHELGHHLQNQLGVTDKVERAPLASQKGESGLSVRTELQADCFAGVWAQSANKRNLLDPGDIDEATRAAAAVGDDRLQKEATGSVQPERWTHGSSEERRQWFMKGYQSGSINDCNTFDAPRL
jgi:predicted metalloprotease